jgi:hypothetical protein
VDELTVSGHAQSVIEDAGRTPGLPGMLGEFMWVDSPDFGGSPADRRIPRVYDVDPAPLARLIAVALKAVPGDWGKLVRELAEDDRDGPIHLVHLLAACEYAARRTGGSLTRVGGILGPLADALSEGGIKDAVEAAQIMDAETRAGVLDLLTDHCCSAVTGLCIDITDDLIARQQP